MKLPTEAVLEAEVKSAGELPAGTPEFHWAVSFQLAEVAVPRQLFAVILERVGRLRLACGSG